MTRIDVLGVEFDPVGPDEAVARVAALAAEPAPHLVVTANVETVMLARRTPDLREILRGAALVVADGVGVVWGSRQLGRPLPCRVPGVEFAELVCAEAARRGWGVYLLGGRPGVAAGAAQRLRARHPALRVAGAASGYFSAANEAAVIRAIREAAPVLLLAGLGMPRQERWLARHLADLGARVAMGIGGAMDVWTGRARRAPRAMQTLGLEWCYRLIREPRRFGRQLAIPHFMGVVYGERLRALGRPPSPGS